MQRLPFRRPAVRTLILAFVLGLHGAAWWLLDARGPVVRQLPATVTVRLSLRWLPPPTLVPQPPQAEPAPEVKRPAPPRKVPRATLAPAAPERIRTSAPTTAPTRRETIAAPAPPTTATASAARPAQAAASGVGPPLPGILDSPATRQAILDAARAPSLAELPGTTRRAGQRQQLGSAIASGAHGDCDKGEFAGGGMGLLSLPFWAVAKLRGDCGR